MDLIQEHTRYPELAYMFKHALTQEVAYGSLLQDRRKALHARVLEAIERLHSERRDEYVELLTHHAIGAGLWQQAVDYCRQAGRRSQARAAAHEAAAALRGEAASIAREIGDRESLGTALADWRPWLGCGAATRSR